MSSVIAAMVNGLGHDHDAGRIHASGTVQEEVVIDQNMFWVHARVAKVGLFQLSLGDPPVVCPDVSEDDCSGGEHSWYEDWRQLPPKCNDLGGIVRAAPPIPTTRLALSGAPAASSFRYVRSSHPTFMAASGDFAGNRAVTLIAVGVVTAMKLGHSGHASFNRPCPNLMSYKQAGFTGRLPRSSARIRLSARTGASSMGRGRTASCRCSRTQARFQAPVAQQGHPRELGLP